MSGVTRLPPLEHNLFMGLSESRLESLKLVALVGVVPKSEAENMLRDVYQYKDRRAPELLLEIVDVNHDGVLDSRVSHSAIITEN